MATAEFEEFDGMQLTELMIWNRALSRIGDYRLTFQSAKAVTSATAANPVVVTATAHGNADGDLVVLTNFDMMVEVNARVFRAENPTANTFELADENGLAYTAETGGFVRKLGASKAAFALFYAWPLIRDSVLRAHPWNAVMKRDRLARLDTAKTITAITKANPGVVTTSAAHGYAAGDVVKLDRVLGMIEVNDRFFTLGTVPTTTTFNLPIDTTNYTTYSSAGRTQKALTPLTPDAGYANVFDLPSDCLRLIEEFRDFESHPLWEVSGRQVFTDDGITVPIRYLRRLRDTTLWDPLLQDYMAQRLAYEIVEEIAGVPANKKDQLRRDMEGLESKARAVDSQEGSANPPAKDAWELARA